ncbi:MAG: sulfatase, partial [Oscillospiraceae bacterium]|nr:sulfatase [Oscillospiraceae bacterium]
MIIANNHLTYLIKKYYSRAIEILLLIIFSVVMSYLTEWIMRNSFNLTKEWVLLYPVVFRNVSIFITLSVLSLYLLIRRAWLTVLISGTLLTVMSCVNYYKFLLRNEPFFPWDLTSIGEAAEILPSTKLTVTKPICIAIYGILILAVLLFFWRRITKPGKIVRLASCFCLSLCILAAFSTIKFAQHIFYDETYLTSIKILENKFQQDKSYKKNGFILSFFINIKYLQPRSPKVYSESAVSDIVDGIKKQKASNVKPNIIMIMNESWGDVTLFKNVKFKEDVFKTVTELREKYMSGYLLTPGFGGGTCNSEFEVLTGNSMLNVPTGSTPYLQYIKRNPFPSYPSFLKQLGYNTVAIHSYGRKFWSRDKVYPKMQFDEFIAREDFVNPERQRGWISDMETMRKVISSYEKNKSTGKPFFNYTITMQNHGTYRKEGYDESHVLSLEAPTLGEAERIKFTCYATGVRDADRALGFLIDYFKKNVKEPTIIAMFGDHLGELGNINKSYVAG